MIVAVINNKGGVGKTTSALNLAAALADAGQRVLLVDLDAQASASLSIGLGRDELHPSIADALLDGADVAGMARETPEGFDLIPGSRELAAADVELAAKYGRELRLQRALSPLGDRYDVVLIDCPPSFSLLTANALLASDAYLVPVEPHYMALEGVASLLENVEDLADAFGGIGRRLGFLLTKVDRRTRLTEETVELLRASFPGEVFSAEIPLRTRVAEAPSHGQTALVYDASGDASAAYRAAAEELQRRLSRPTA